MTTYKEIKGTQIEVVSSDPSNPVEGQVWYNSTDQAVKGQAITAAGSFSSGGNLNSARYIAGGAGTRDASLIIGGFIGPGELTITESYNGTTFSEVADLNLKKGAMGDGGTPSSAMAAGGQSSGGQTATTELWNGSSWTEVNDLGTARRYLAGGIESSTAGVVFGGITPSSTPGTGATETWNGTNWTEVNDLNNPRRSLCGVGTSTAGLAFAGYDGSPQVYTETWNGTNWTEVNDMSTTSGWGGSFGISTLALNSSGTTVQDWNGTNWSSGTSNSDNKTNRAGNGTTTAGMLAGGEPPGPAGVVSTEEYVGPGVSQTRTFTDS